MLTITHTQDEVSLHTLKCTLEDGSEFIVFVDRKNNIHYPRLSECTPQIARLVAEMLLMAARLVEGAP